jgi:hypothetical protein
VKPRPYAGSLILMIAIVAVIGYDSLQENDAQTEGPQAGASGTARVERAVDGDTVILSEGLGSSRIVGVDTPETVKPDTPVQCFGPRASAFTKRMLEKGREVPLSRRPRTGRPLRPDARLHLAAWRALLQRHAHTSGPCKAVAVPAEHALRAPPPTPCRERRSDGARTLVTLR